MRAHAAATAVILEEYSRRNGLAPVIGQPGAAPKGY